MANGKDKETKASATRSEPEDRGFAVYTLGPSCFQIGEGSDLSEALKGVRIGASLRREGKRPDGSTALRELLTASGVELDVKAQAAEIHLWPPTVEIHFADATGGPDGVRMTWACFAERVTPDVLWVMLAKGMIEDGDTLWVYADAVTEKDAEIMGRIVKLRLC